MIATTSCTDIAAAVAAAGTGGVPSQAYEPNVHPVDLTVTVGPRGLGLILGKEEEGSRWVVKGFRAMPDGEPNPAEVSIVSLPLVVFFCDIFFSRIFFVIQYFFVFWKQRL